MMEFDDALYNRQPNSIPGHRSFSGFIYFIERFKDMNDFVLWDALAIVSYGNFNSVVYLASFHLNFTRFSSEFNTVPDQIDPELSKLAFISQNRHFHQIKFDF